MFAGPQNLIRNMFFVGCVLLAAFLVRDWHTKEFPKNDPYANYTNYFPDISADQADGVWKAWNGSPSHVWLLEQEDETCQKWTRGYERGRARYEVVHELTTPLSDEGEPINAIPKYDIMAYIEYHLCKFY